MIYVCVIDIEAMDDKLDDRATLLSRIELLERGTRAVLYVSLYKLLLVTECLYVW